LQVSDAFNEKCLVAAWCPISPTHCPAAVQSHNNSSRTEHRKISVITHDMLNGSDNGLDDFKNLSYQRGSSDRVDLPLLA
jgi:hypothetical protein